MDLQVGSLVDVAPAGAGARQRVSKARLGWKNCGGAVAVVNVEVNGHGSRYLSFLVHALDGHSNVVNHTEAFPMIGKYVMKPATDVQGEAIAQSQAGRQNRAAGGQPEGFYQLRRVGNFHLQLFL